MKKIKLMSLFSGIGAFEKGMKDKGIDYELINYCEIDKYASYAYSVMHEVDENLNLGDVSKVDTSNIKEFDLLTYGFPCQDISLAGNMKGIIKGETRSGLLFEALRIIKDKKPKFAIAENVRNLVSKKFIDDFNNMLKELDRMGYNSYWQILNSKNYGVAQSRERVFVVSVRKDIDNGNFEFPEQNPNLIPLKSILEDNVNERFYVNNSYVKDFIKDLNDKLIDNKKPNAFGLIKVGEIKNPKTLDMNKRVFSTNGVSPTITTNSDSIPKIVECKIRKLTPKECWLAQGFSENDYIKVKQELENKFYNGGDRATTQLYKMAGNSISVPVAGAIIENLIKQVNFKE